MKRLLVSACALFFLLTATKAQEETRGVVLMPFQSTSPEQKATTAQLQDLVLKLLSAKENVSVVDRSKDKIVIAELDNQIRAVSVAAKNLAAQGKLQGARELIVGNVTEATAEAVDEMGNPLKQQSNSNKSSSGTNGNNSTAKKDPGTERFTGLVTFSLELIDVETGLVVEQANFTGNTIKTDAANKTTKALDIILRKKKAPSAASTASQMAMPDTKEKALLAALNSTENEIAIWINKVYAPPMKIIAVDARSKGLPSTVLVSGLDAGIKKGTTIFVTETIWLDGGAGKKLKQEKKVATLKVQELQGEVTVCKVTDGEEELEGKISGKNKIELSLK